MRANRVQFFVPKKKPAAATKSTAAVPAPSLVAQQVPEGFAVVPPQLAIAQPWQQELLQSAYEKAKAVASVPRHYRLLFSVWN